MKSAGRVLVDFRCRLYDSGRVTSRALSCLREVLPRAKFLSRSESHQLLLESHAKNTERKRNIYMHLSDRG